MKYGLARKLYVYDFGTEMGEELIATGGDYTRSQLWCKKNLKDVDADLADLFQSLAWVWYALKRNGKLADYGVGAELTQDTLLDMFDGLTFQFESFAEDALPLASTATQPRK